MMLYEYIEENGTTIAFIARKVCCSREHLSNIVHGNRPCTKAMARLIAYATKGMVTEAEMLKIYKENKRKEIEEEITS